MGERPILFSGTMVRAILDGRKTQTRRVIKPQPTYQGIDGFCFELHPFAPSTLKGTPAEGMKWAPEKKVWVAEDCYKNIVGVLGDCPYGQPGDRLWVRETWADLRGMGFDCQVGYSADTRPGSDGDETRKIFGVKWKPSIHMPRWASRITLEITGVRVQPLQDISEEDAMAEGASAYDPTAHFTVNQIRESDQGIADFEYRSGFAELWESIASDGSRWRDNPWVWVVEFKRLSP